jgi:hypothetical protein
MSNLSREQMYYQLQYLGAFGILGVTNVAAASELAAITITGEECAHAISVMRRHQGEVYPGVVNRALDALREIRAQDRGPDTEPAPAPVCPECDGTGLIMDMDEHDRGCGPGHPVRCGRGCEAQ